MKQRPSLFPVTSKGLDQASSETVEKILKNTCGKKMIEIQCWDHSEAIFSAPPPKFTILVKLYQSPLGICNKACILPDIALKLKHCMKLPALHVFPATLFKETFCFLKVLYWTFWLGFAWYRIVKKSQYFNALLSLD